MKFTKTPLDGVFVIEPQVFGDERGFFLESYNERRFCEAIGRDVKFVQDNHSKSSLGVLRGLHYQSENTQGKLVRVIKGAVFDVAVDLRKSSPSFGKWFGVELNAENKKQLWIPEGFAHGFLVLSDDTEFLYKTTDFYTHAAERTLMWNDPELGIKWPSLDVEFILSEKDKCGDCLVEAKKFK